MPRLIRVSSWLSPLSRLMHSASSTNTNGSAVLTAPACSAARAALPPTASSTPATTPSITAQNTRWGTGESVLPPAVMLSMTSEPEADEVMKNTSTSSTPRMGHIEASGRSVSIWNSASSDLSTASTSSPTPADTGYCTAPPKAVMQMVVTMSGIMSTAVMNSRTVRPRDTRAINMPTNGDHEIHQAQKNTVQPW